MEHTFAKSRYRLPSARCLDQCLRHHVHAGKTCEGMDQAHVRAPEEAVILKYSWTLTSDIRQDSAEKHSPKGSEEAGKEQERNEQPGSVRKRVLFQRPSKVGSAFYIPPSAKHPFTWRSKYGSHCLNTSRAPCFTLSDALLVTTVRTFELRPFTDSNTWAHQSPPG